MSLASGTRPDCLRAVVSYLYCIAQEGLPIAVKQSGVKDILIMLGSNKKRVVLSIHGDTAGFDSLSAQREGLGFRQHGTDPPC